MEPQKFLPGSIGEQIDYSQIKIDDLRTAPDQSSYIMRVGALYAKKLITVQQAKTLTQPLGVTLFDAIPDIVTANQGVHFEHKFPAHKDSLIDKLITEIQQGGA